MAVKGVFASDQNIQGTRKGDFAGALLQTIPTGNAPLLALSSGMQSKDAADTVVTWFEENHHTGRASVTNNAASGTSLVVADASAVVSGQIYYVESTGEYIFVETVAGTTLTVTRGFAGTSITALDGSGTAKAMQRIGTAYEEGSAKPTSYANIGFPRYNYVQLFRTAWDVTGTARAVDFITGDVVAKNQRDAALFHSEDIERSILWGRKTLGTLNGKPFRTMDGIKAQLSSNLSSQGANLTWDEIDAFLQTIFEKNIKGKPNERISFCGNKVVQVFNKIARLQTAVSINIEPGVTEFGMKIFKWLTPYGDITLLTHPLFTENPTFTEDWLVLHPGATRMRWLRRTQEDRNDSDGSRAGADADFGVFTSELCIEYMAEATGGYFTGINTASGS